MENIEKISKIKRETLSDEYYFKSLLEQAYILGMLSDIQLEKIQFDCLSFLAKKTDSFNNGNSSSIRVEVAQNLMNSIAFTIGVCLKTYPNPDDAAVALQNEGIEILYQKGCERIERLIKSTKILHALIVRNLVQTKNVFYSSTIVDGIKGFFKLYYPEFAAQEIHITADYPVHHFMKKLQGIEFIEKYLECVYYENLFCSRFSSEDLHKLLWSYHKQYEVLIFNIYEPVLSSAIGCILSSGDIQRLKLEPSSTEILSNLFDGKTRREIDLILVEAVDKLSEKMRLPDALKRYLIESLPQISLAIENAMFLQTLDYVFIKR